MNARAQLVGFELPRIEIEEQEQSVAMSRDFAALAYDDRVSDTGAPRVAAGQGRRAAGGGAVFDRAGDLDADGGGGGGRV